MYIFLINHQLKFLLNIKIVIITWFEYGEASMLWDELVDKFEIENDETGDENEDPWSTKRLMLISEEFIELSLDDMSTTDSAMLSVFKNPFKWLSRNSTEFMTILFAIVFYSVMASLKIKCFLFNFLKHAHGIYMKFS